MNDSTSTWADIANQGPMVALLLLFLMGFVRGWWVTWREHKVLMDDRDYWRQAANRAAGIAETVIDVPGSRTQQGASDERS